MQMAEHFSFQQSWADLGSGAGFPGIVVALLNNSPTTPLSHLIESDRRKAAFLTEAARVTEAKVLVHPDRVERILPQLKVPLTAVLSRAVAPLDKLLLWSGHHIEAGATGLFLKGRKTRHELNAVLGPERFVFEFLPSKTSTTGEIVRVKSRGHSKLTNP